MEAYRSGHNGHDWKSCSLHGLRGSNPLASAKNKRMVFAILLFFCVSRGDSNKICLQILVAFRKESCRGAPTCGKRQYPLANSNWSMLLFYRKQGIWIKFACKFWASFCRGAPTCGKRQPPLASFNVAKEGFERVDSKISLSNIFTTKNWILFMSFVFGQSGQLFYVL